MLARHDWRKVAPDTRHPKSDPQAQQDWKKNYVGKVGLSKLRGFADDPGWTAYPEAKDGQNRCSAQTHDPEDPADA
jgi:hypothetical protein